MLRSDKFQILFWRLSVRQWTGHHLFTYLSSPIWHQTIIWTNADLLSIGLPTLTSVANDLLNDVLRLDNGASATYGSARMSRQNNCTPNNTFYFREILINIQNISVKKNALETRAGVKYVLSNTNTNTNTFFSRVSNTNTNTNTPAKIWSNTNTNTAHQIQIQIHNEAETKLPPFYRWHIQIHCIVRRLSCLFKFHWKLFPKVQSTVISLHWFR